MLDQNTDRMWYVIGAVIIGAAIIFILNGTAPELFASIGGTFEDKAKDVTEVVDGIGPASREVEYVTSDEVYFTQSQLKEYDVATNTWIMNVEPTTPNSTWHDFGGLSIDTKRFVIPYGATLTFSYDIYAEQSVTNTSDFNSYPVDKSIPTWNGNDNHVALDGYARSRVLPAKQWQTVVFKYSNTHVKNAHKVDLYDNSRIGVVNPTTKGLEVKIRNIRIQVSE